MPPLNDQTLLLIGASGCVALLAFAVSRLVLARAAHGGKLRSRLIANNAPDPRPQPSAARSAVVPLLEKVSQAAAQPFMPKDREQQSALRRKLALAGIYSPAAPRLVTGSRMICLLLGLAGGYLFSLWYDSLLLGVSLGGLAGYVAPTLWLKTRISGNQKALVHALPDALDLMVVCVEAGLTIDAAMQRVGQDLAIAHPALARELNIAHMETRVGLSRAESLRNLGVRTGCEALQSLAAMLIQADRFGTSIAQALRIHADSLRAARQHAAEELAAKASVKMSFPLVLFIFPATFIILAGPTVIELMNSAFFN